MRDRGRVLSVDTRSPLMCENQILRGCYQRELREPRRAWIDVMPPTSPHPPLALRDNAAAQLYLAFSFGGRRCGFQLSCLRLVLASFWFGVPVSQARSWSCSPPLNFLFLPCFYVKELSFRAATWWERI